MRRLTPFYQNRDGSSIVGNQIKRTEQGDICASFHWGWLRWLRNCSRTHRRRSSSARVGPFGRCCRIADRGWSRTYSAVRCRLPAVFRPKNAAIPKRPTAEAILKIVDADAPLLRFALGAGLLLMARAGYADRLATWEAWGGVSKAAQGEPKQAPSRRCERWRRMTSTFLWSQTRSLAK
jgi:hypothetical protein